MRAKVKTMPERPEGENRLLTASQVAEYLGTSMSGAYRLMQRGTVPVVRIGRSIRTPLKALQAWIDRQTTPGRGQAA